MQNQTLTPTQGAPGGEVEELRFFTPESVKVFLTVL